MGPRSGPATIHYDTLHGQQRITQHVHMDKVLLGLLTEDTLQDCFVSCATNNHPVIGKRVN